MSRALLRSQLDEHIFKNRANGRHFLAQLGDLGLQALTETIDTAFKRRETLLDAHLVKQSLGDGFKRCTLRFRRGRRRS